MRGFLLQLSLDGTGTSYKCTDENYIQARCFHCLSNIILTTMTVTYLFNFIVWYLTMSMTFQSDSFTLSSATHSKIFYFIGMF